MSEFNDEEEIINEDFEEDDEEFEEDVEEKMKDVGELKEILQAVSTEIPDLIFGSLYSSEIAIEYGKGVGSLYKELKNQGLPEEMIRKIISDFTSNVNILGNIKVNKDRSSKELISLNSLT